MQGWRVNLILIGIFLFAGLIVGRLFYIQVIKSDFYKALAQGLYSLEGTEELKRGEIFFSGGEPLAINMDWPLVFASPEEIEDKEQTAEKLAEILKLDKEFLLEKIKGNNLYSLIKKRLTEEEINEIAEIDLEGVYLGKETGRYYPHEDLASQLVGFLDVEQKGQYGLEGYYDDILKGGEDSIPSDIYLTIDYSIQFTAEKLLEWAEENLNIEGGEIIVIDPNTGKVLALANFPNFNPNQYSKVNDLEIFQNSVTQKLFEPGSTFKPITMAAALDEGKITPKTTYMDEGTVKIGGYTISNYNQRVFGEASMTTVLEKSINTGAVFVEAQLGHTLFMKYIEDFELFKPTDIDLTETYSENKEFKKGYEINFATASFGQGIEMTAIQLIRAYSAIANGGNLVRPYLVEKIKTDEQIIEIEPKVNAKAILSPKTVSQLTAMLVSVVENGYAKPARIPGYYIAGKTGTSQIAWSALGVDKKGYSDKTWQTFMGFVPAFNPQFLILVKLNNPETRTAEYSAVPVFHDLAKHIIDYWQIPPDYE